MTARPSSCHLGDDRDTCETGHGLMLMCPDRGLTCGWLPLWSVVRWLSASAFVLFGGQLWRSQILQLPECLPRRARSSVSGLAVDAVEQRWAPVVAVGVSELRQAPVAAGHRASAEWAAATACHGPGLGPGVGG